MTRFLQLLTIGAAAYTVWAITAPLLAWPHTTATIIADEQPMLLVDELLMQTDWIGPAQTRAAWTGISTLAWCLAGLAAQRWGKLLVPASDRAVGAAVQRSQQQHDGGDGE